jgi:hypothetical protein
MKERDREMDEGKQIDKRLGIVGVGSSEVRIWDHFCITLDQE